MNGLATKVDKTKTSWILLMIWSTLTISIIYWYVGSPQRFIELRLGYHEELLGNLMVWLFTLAIILTYSLYTVYAIPFIKSHLFTFNWLKIIGIWAAFATGIVEEVLFRQVLMDYLYTLNVSSVAQIILSGLAFGLAHGAWGLLRGEVKVVFPVIVSTTILGCLLAALYIFSGRSTLAPIVAHVVINMIIEPWLMLSAVSGKWK
ncbi:CPBP family intramembrane glutamic endopeptidase [Alkalihalobacillus sp. FSL W8-0930]